MWVRTDRAAGIQTPHRTSSSRWRRQSWFRAPGISTPLLVMPPPHRDVGHVRAGHRRWHGAARPGRGHRLREKGAQPRAAAAEGDTLGAGVRPRGRGPRGRGLEVPTCGHRAQSGRGRRDRGARPSALPGPQSGRDLSPASGDPRVGRRAQALRKRGSPAAPAANVATAHSPPPRALRGGGGPPGGLGLGRAACGHALGRGAPGPPGAVSSAAVTAGLEAPETQRGRRFPAHSHRTP